MLEGLCNLNPIKRITVQKRKACKMSHLSLVNWQWSDSMSESLAR